MNDFFSDDFEVVEEIEELYSFIPDVEASIDEDDMEFIYEDLEDEAGDIDF